MKINTQDFLECFRYENRNYNVYADSTDALLKSRNRDLKTCNEQLKIISNSIEESTQFINLNPDTDTSFLKLEVKGLKEHRDIWEELKELRIKKFLSPSYIIAYITFPGIIFHEFSHWLACKCVGAKVFSIVLFSDSIDFIDNMREGYDKDTAKAIDVYGYVSHRKVNGYSKNFLLGFSPFIFGTFASIVIFTVFLFISTNVLWIDLLLGWLGLSIAYNAFPSIGSDDKGINNAIIHDPKVHVPSFTRYFALLSTPIVVFMAILINKFKFQYKRCNLYQILYPIFLFLIVELYKMWSLNFISSLSIAIMLFTYYSIQKFKGVFTDMRNEYFAKS